MITNFVLVSSVGIKGSDCIMMLLIITRQTMWICNFTEATRSMYCHSNDNQCDWSVVL